jgi:hypothetical protein
MMIVGLAMGASGYLMTAGGYKEELEDIYEILAKKFF